MTVDDPADPDDDRILFRENCKHSGHDALIVQRNEGIRWVTCVDCGADFVRRELYEAVSEERDMLLAHVLGAPPAVDF